MSASIRLLLDQNVPYPVLRQLRVMLPGASIWHVLDEGLRGHSDEEVMAWAAARDAVTITFDEDLADLLRFPLGSHSGVVRLRHDPCTVELTIKVLTRLFESVRFEELSGNLTIADAVRIRVVTKPVAGT